MSSGPASIRTIDATTDLHLLAATAASQNRTSAVDLQRLDRADTLINVSMDDLLDHTWHYQCVVSPAFPAALKHIIIPATSSDPQNKSVSPHDIIISSAAASHHVDHLLRKPNGALICNTSKYGSASSQYPDQDAGYVSLASLIVNTSPSSTESASSSCVSSPTSVHDQSPHHHHYIMGLPFDHLFNFLRKQNKSRSTATRTFTSATGCRDSARRSATSRCSAAADSINGLNYASYVTVD